MAPWCSGPAGNLGVVCSNLVRTHCESFKECPVLKETLKMQEALIDELRIEIATLEACCETPSTIEESFQCTNVEHRGDYTMMYAEGSWPGFCRILTNAGEIGETWTRGTVSVELQNYSPGYGHPGVIYNAQDENNYNYIFFRPHKYGCYQRGDVTNGVVTRVGADSHGAYCPGGRVGNKEWFSVRVEITTTGVTIYLNDVETATAGPPLNRGTKAGVLVATGFSNTIYYRNLQQSWASEQ